MRSDPDETDDTTPAPPALAGFQRRYLRGLAQSLRPVVHVGAAGPNAGVLRAIAEALHTHELIKVRLHEPDDKKALARSLAEACGAALCGLVGHTVILYRPRPESPGIRLPERGPSV